MENEEPMEHHQPADQEQAVEQTEATEQEGLVEEEEFVEEEILMSEEKKALLANIASAYDEFFDAITGLSDEQFCEPALAGGRSIKDVRIHLAEWQHRLAMWTNLGLCHQTPVTPLEGYTWDEIDRLNEDTFRDYQEMSKGAVLNYGQAVHRHLYEQIENLTDDGIFKPGFFIWTSDQPLLTYIIKYTYEHFHEHTQQIQELVSTWKQ
jgi:hypothetical protein